MPTTPEDIRLSPAEALREAQRLLDIGYPFHAHEVLEAAWKAAPDEERELWRGLAQLAVGLTHAERGNTTGASALLLRAADRIEAYAGSAPHGIPAGALAEWAREKVREDTTWAQEKARGNATEAREKARGDATAMPRLDGKLS